MYALLKDEQIIEYPYSVARLMADNPNTSFPRAPTEELLSGWGVVPVEEAEPPAHDANTAKAVEGAPVLVGGKWRRSWSTVSLSADELAQLALDKDERRRRAYQQEADPLFFKWQRGEATMDAWLAKISEIKQRT